MGFPVCVVVGGRGGGGAQAVWVDGCLMCTCACTRHTRARIHTRTDRRIDRVADRASDRETQIQTNTRTHAPEYVVLATPRPSASSCTSLAAWTPLCIPMRIRMPLVVAAAASKEGQQAAAGGHEQVHMATQVWLCPTLHEVHYAPPYLKSASTQHPHACTCTCACTHLKTRINTRIHIHVHAHVHTRT